MPFPAATHRTCAAPAAFIAAATATATAVLALLPACATHGAADRIDLYAGQSRPGAHVTVADFGASQVLDGNVAVVPKPASPSVPESHVEVRRSAHRGAGDALTLHFDQSWYADLRFEGGAPLDLRPYLSDGTVEFDLDVHDMAQGGLTVTMSCGPECSRKVPYLRDARAAAGLGWRHVSFAMSCFVRDGDDFGAVTNPLSLDASGTGEFAVSDVRIVRHGQPDAACPDYRTQSVTPVRLDESWSINWWLPRHDQKMKDAAELRAEHHRAEVVFIGDSIIQNWENAGKNVWASHYAKYDAIDLGFGGDHTENVLWRLQHGELDALDPKVVVLMLGTNNTGDRQEDPRTTALGVRKNLDEIRTRLPHARVLLLAVFPRDEKPDSRLRKLNDRVNDILRTYADGDRVVFLDLGPALTNPDGTLSRDVMPDLLHPNARGYEIWAEHMAPTLQELLSRP